jgi:hypothetical protein
MAEATVQKEPKIPRSSRIDPTSRLRERVWVEIPQGVQIEYATIGDYTYLQECGVLSSTCGTWTPRCSSPSTRRSQPDAYPFLDRGASWKRSSPTRG